MTNANLSIIIDAKTNGARAELQHLKKDLGSVDSSLKTIGANVGYQNLSAGLGKLTGAASELTKASSALNEAQNKSNVIFKESAAEMDRWAGGAAKAFGQSKREALSAAAGFGNMFDQLGVGSKEAATMSKSVTELASDFASFHDADISQVLLAQSAAFRGEYDSLQRFLPLINAATVEQKAMAETGKSNAKELTAQEKALTVYKLMLEGAGEAQGDFERTSGGLANQQRTLKGVQEDLAAAQGKIIMPAQIALNKALLEMPPILQVATSGLANFGPALAQTSIGLLAMGPALAAAGKSFSVLRAGALAMVPALGAMTLAVGAAYVGWLAFDKLTGTNVISMKSREEATKRLETATGLERDGLLKLIAALDAKEKEESDGAKATDIHAAALVNAKRAAGDFGQKIKDISQAAKDLNGDLGDATNALAGFGQVKTPEVLKAEAAVLTIDEQLADAKLKRSQAEMDGSAKVLTPEGRERVAAAKDNVAEALRDRTKAQAEWNKVVALNPINTFASQEDREAHNEKLAAAGERMVKAQKDYNKASDEQRKAGSENLTTASQSFWDAEIERIEKASERARLYRDSLTTQVPAAIARETARVGSDQKAEGIAVENAGVIAAVKTASQELIDLPAKTTTAAEGIAAAIEPAKESFKDFLLRVSGVPPEVAAIGVAAENNGPPIRVMGEILNETTRAMILDAKGAEDAIARVGAFVARHPEGNLLADLAGLALPSRDVGGPVAAGQPYMIGRGPYTELFVPKQSGTVIPGGMSEFQRQQAFGGGEQGAYLSGLDGYINGRPVSADWMKAYGGSSGGGGGAGGGASDGWSQVKGGWYNPRAARSFQSARPGGTSAAWEAFKAQKIRDNGIGWADIHSIATFETSGARTRSNSVTPRRGGNSGTIINGNVTINTSANNFDAAFSRI